MKKIQSVPILNEITPLVPGSCLYVVEREKRRYDFPIHVHSDYELNFIQGSKGALRIAGDSFQEIDDWDLVLIGKNLEHGWRAHNADMSRQIEEITIQFPETLFSNSLFDESIFSSINDMLSLSTGGLSFSAIEIDRVLPMIRRVARQKDSFYRFTSFLELMYELSLSRQYTILSKFGIYADGFRTTDASTRLKQIFDFIDKNYGRDMTLNMIADAVNISESTLSHFFKANTGKSLSSYILCVRIGAAAQHLIRTQMSVSEICYACGFNNCSYFNRQFKKIQGVSPSDFRRMYEVNVI